MHKKEKIMQKFLSRQDGGMKKHGQSRNNPKPHREGDQKG